MSTESTSNSTSGPFESLSAGDLLDSFEFRSVRRIVVFWFAALVVAASIQRGPYNFAAESFQVVVCCLGLAMASLWTVFYGELGWRRLVLYVAIVLLTTWIGVFLNAGHGDYVEMTLASTLAAVFVLAPFYLAKKFLGWRIVHPTQLQSVDGYGSQFSIAQIMSWTTFVAVFVVIANLVASKLFQSDLPQFLFFVFVAIVIPATIALLYLVMIGRLSTRSLVIATPLFALGVAIALTLILGISNATGGNILYWVFWPNWIWFSIAGWAITAAVWFLRRRGFVFGFGGVLPAQPETALEFQVRSLESRIASTSKWRRRARIVNAWVVQRLNARKSRLEAELQSLRDYD